MKSYSLPAIILSVILVLSGCDSGSTTKVRNNVAYEYYDNGKIKTEAQVIHDTLAHGLYKMYTPDGYLEKVYTYVEGKREGPAVTYYNNGQVRTKLNFKDNKLNGTVTMYYKTGELYRVTQYVNGEIQGIRKTYYKNGNIMSEVPYKNDFPGLGTTEYSKEGKPENDMPHIEVIPINRLAMENTYILRISLSRKEPSTTYYIGDLDDGKYIHKGLWPHKPAGNYYDYKVQVHKGGFMMESMTISATYMTHHNSWAVVSRKYNLAIDNK